MRTSSSTTNEGNGIASKSFKRKSFSSKRRFFIYHSKFSDKVVVENSKRKKVF
jgi:hypothetical protein